MSHVQDPGSNRQVQKELTIEQAQLEQKQYTCYWCDHNGIVQSQNNHSLRGAIVTRDRLFLLLTL